MTAVIAWILALTQGSSHVAAQRAAQAPAPAPRAAQAAAPAPGAAEYNTLMKSYCLSCHNQRLQTGGLSLDTVDLSQIGEHAEVLEKVARKVEAGMMPPLGMPRPDPAVRDTFVSWLKTGLDRAGATHANPGRPLLYRLNRAQYARAVKDLLALDIDAGALLPPDDAGYGFDNISDLLGISPILLERYLSAADRVTALALGDQSLGATSQVFRVRQDASQNKHVEGLPLGTVGGLVADATLPLDGEYEISVKLFRTNLGTMKGLEYEHELEITVDGARVFLVKLGGNNELKASSDNPTVTANAVDARLKVKVPIKAGPHAITAAFLEKSGALGSRRLQNYVRSSQDTVDYSGMPHIDRMTLSGPFNVTGSGDTPSRQRILTCRPSAAADEAACAKQIISAIARRAYRGNVTPADINRLMKFYGDGRSDGGSFESGIELALRRILAGPKFIFRAERDPADAVPGKPYRISDLELASRLSFFLWGSIPDDELLDVAGRGQLRNAAVLEKQVRRMLADPKSEALTADFAGQWLYLRNLAGQVPNSNEFPDFDDQLRTAFREETEQFFDSIVREDHNVLDLLTANYSFVNERLARHYGIPNVRGSHFRRVTVPDERRGLLGKGSMLLVTSHPDRTSPVRRGKWVLENIMGTPPPPPPPVVPPLKEKSELETPKTMREQMEAHRANPTCAACHRLMDPLGFALDNFDAVGGWRSNDEGNKIDASGVLPNGTPIDGINGLRAALMQRPQVFVQTLTEKLMTYGLGRGVQYYDMPGIRSIIGKAAGENYRFSSLVLGIVKSAPFQMRVKLAEAPEARQTAAN